jgi:hypothetical protein
MARADRSTHCRATLSQAAEADLTNSISIEPPAMFSSAPEADAVAKRSAKLPSDHCKTFGHGLCASELSRAAWQEFRILETTCGERKSESPKQNRVTLTSLLKNAIATRRRASRNGRAVSSCRDLLKNSFTRQVFPRVTEALREAGARLKRRFAGSMR